MQNAKCRMQNYRVFPQLSEENPANAPPAVPAERFIFGAFCILLSAFCVLFYSPMDCMTLFRAVFMGSVSGSLEEGSPLQSQS